MDQRLVAWARSVKARGRTPHPPLWLFTDATRLPDPRAAVAGLPPGLCGVVFRHDAVPGRAALAREVARLCRARRVRLVISGDWRLAAALGAGEHLRLAQGERARRRTLAGAHTASVHGLREALAARRAGAGLVFLSPAFPTLSHPGAPALGARRWAAIAGRCRLPVLALGGVDGGSVRRLAGARCAGAGAIGALAPRLGGNTHLR
jgi:thiamine-phosphate pyrophosphorylase